MRRLDKELQNRSIDISKLICYGFIEKNDNYEYQDYILDKKFKVIVNYSNSKMTSKVIDIETNEEYILVDISSASGKFLGEIQEEYNDKLMDIINKCSIIEIFKSEYAKLVTSYIKNKYNTDLEFLWLKVSNNAVFRHKENKKWYGVLLIVSERKLGLDSDKIVEIIDLKNMPEEILKLVDNIKYFAGYHMNKKHWFTIKLDGSVPIETIYKFIDISFSIK